MPGSMASKRCGRRLPAADIRPAIAHDEIVDPVDFPRYKMLGTIPVLSFQWEKPAGDTMGLRDYFGPARMKILEPAGISGRGRRPHCLWQRLASGPLRRMVCSQSRRHPHQLARCAAEYRGRLGDDPGLSREAVLRAITIDAAYELHQDETTGSLEVGKFADLIVLDRNPLQIPAEDIANIKVLETVVGGNVIYQIAGH